MPMNEGSHIAGGPQMLEVEDGMSMTILGSISTTLFPHGEIH